MSAVAARSMLWSARDGADAETGQAHGGAGTTHPIDAATAERTRAAIGQAASRARVARQAFSAERARACRIDTAVAGAGLAGLACLSLPMAAVQAPWGGDCQSLATIAGLLLLALPTVRAACGAGAREDTADTLLAAAAARAGAVVTLGNRLLRELREAHGGPATSATLRLARGMLDAVEAEAESVAATAREGHARRAAARHARIVPRMRKVIVTTGDGRRLTGSIQDVSLSGVAFSEPLPRVGVGDMVGVGQRMARVVRTWERGLAMQFTEPLDRGTFDEWVTL
ncbi:hypothetical protein [Lichenibacterium dinghuense]|uniref:hypothetical protein n=1 Tax=Lichenibacterium dinghuense TaxID=2895977 RepID=UPI001F48AF23|nr:hypothetical protein [Lichenibacterium sp. 6Y81]